MNLTQNEIKQIIQEELRNLLNEFKSPDVKDVEITIKPASHAKAQAELQRQFAIKQKRQ